LIDGLVPDESSEPLALCWTAHDPSEIGNLLFDIAQAPDCRAFHTHLHRWAGPSLNMVYADVEGNIGYTLVGRVPARVSGHDGRLPVPGWSGEYDWRGYIPFDDLPHQINPPDGMFVTANAKPVTEDYPRLLGHAWMPGFRVTRIAELLNQSEKMAVEDFCEMQFDQKSVLARQVGGHLDRVATELGVLGPGFFAGWDGDLSAASPTAVVYQVFVRRFLYNLIDSLMGDSPSERRLVDRFVGKGPHPLLAPTSLYGPNGRALLANLLDGPDSPLFGNGLRDELVLQSLREAVDHLLWQLGPRVEDWRWGDLHTLTLVHPLGQVRPLNRLFNRGPYPIGGDDTTVWAASAYYHSLESERMVGPVCRFVVDLADLGRSRSLNIPGQSGQPGSPHYADRVEAWFNGDYHPMLYHRQDVLANADATLRLRP
jgi:penicillin amidase